MQTPAACTLLDACDAGALATPAERVLILLEAVCGESRAALGARPLGWLVARLLELRSRLLGPHLECLADCRHCGTVVETELALAELIAAAPTELNTAFEFDAEGLRCAMRLPTAADLIDLRGDPASAARQLVRSVAGLRHSADAPEDRIPAGALTALEAEISRRDPLACIELVLECPACGQRWTDSLRPFDFVWTELNAWCRQLVVEVARLAAGFGWREADILAMSQARRRRYLELLPA